MTNVFKKTGIAAAVAGALMSVSGGAQAFALFENEISLAAPDDVMIVPYVLCDPSATPSPGINTLVGLNTLFPNRDKITTSRDFRPERQISKPGNGAFRGTVHWRFYNTRSEHLLDGVISVTDNDFVRFDWCDQIRKSGQTSLNGRPGYLLFHADALRFNNVRNIYIGTSSVSASSTRETYLDCALREDGCPLSTWQALGAPVAAGSSSILTFDTSVLVPYGTNYVFDQRIWLYGHSYLIQGNWGSQAFIPILTVPIWDTVVRNGYPAIERLVRGINYTTASSSTVYQNIVSRYFLDPALSTGNQMVFWFNSNQDSVRGAVPIETFDSEQVYQFSFTTGLKDELNILRSTPSSPAFPGMIHSENDGATVVNTGLVHFYVGQVNSTVPWASSGVAFNLLALGAGGNNAQVQTEMATAGADLLGPF